MKLHFISCLLLVTVCFSGEVELSPTAQAALNKAYASIKANRVAYDKANAKTFEVTDKALKTELLKLTQSGDFDVAIELKKTIETYKTTIVSKVDTPTKKPEEQKNNDQKENGDKILHPFVGHWNVVVENQKYEWHVFNDGTINNGNMVGSWRIHKESEWIVVQWPNQDWQKVVSIEINVFHGDNKNGQNTVTATRYKNPASR